MIWRTPSFPGRANTVSFDQMHDQSPRVDIDTSALVIYIYSLRIEHTDVFTLQITMSNSQSVEKRKINRYSVVWLNHNKSLSSHSTKLVHVADGR